MKRVLMIGAAALLVACGGDAKDEPNIGSDDVAIALPGGGEGDSEVTDIIGLTDKVIVDAGTLAEILATVESVETAEAVKPRVEAMADSYRATFKAMETMEEPDFATMGKLMSRAPKMAAAQQQVFEQINRINSDHPEAFKVLRRALEDFGG